MDHRTVPGIHIRFDERLWDRAGCGERSRELTPLYLTRYRAARGLGREVISAGWEFSCILSGHGQLQSVGNLPLGPATVYLIPPGITHAETSGEVLESIWMGLAGRALPSADWGGPRGVQSPELTRLFEQAWLLAQHRSRPVGLELDGLARAILGGFLRLVDRPQEVARGQLVEEALRLMYAEFQRPMSIRGLVRQLGCSVGHFQRVFRRITGVSPGEYLAQIRLQHAIMWLESTDLPVAEVAAKVGYTDPLYFSRVMRKSLGCSPSQWRATKRGKP
jgi:AraC-like DNA-binding protein